MADQRERLVASPFSSDHVADRISSHVGVGLAAQPPLYEVTGGGLVLVAGDRDEVAGQFDEGHGYGFERQRVDPTGHRWGRCRQTAQGIER